MASIFLRLHVANHRRLCNRFLRFIVRCFKKRKKNAALHFMPRINAVFALDLSPPLYGRLIARWRHGRWCHRCGKGPGFYSTRGPTGALVLLIYEKLSGSWMGKWREMPGILGDTRMPKAQSSSISTPSDMF